MLDAPVSPLYPTASSKEQRLHRLSGILYLYFSFSVVKLPVGFNTGHHAIDSIYLRGGNKPTDKINLPLCRISLPTPLHAAYEQIIRCGDFYCGTLAGRVATATSHIYRGRWHHSPQCLLFKILQYCNRLCWHHHLRTRPK